MQVSLEDIGNKCKAGVDLAYSGWLRQPCTVIADSGLSGAGRDWNAHYVIYLTARANLDDVIVPLTMEIDLEIHGNQLGTLLSRESTCNGQQLQIEVSHFAGSMRDVAWTLNSQVTA